MHNETILKFGYPDSLLREYSHWVVLLRPKQVTVGSLILACKGEMTGLPEVSPEAFAELAIVTADLEKALRKTFNFDKINYLLLMMVDKQVHFHVIPRYASLRQACGVTFIDETWPKPPSVLDSVPLSDEQRQQLQALIKDNWPERDS